MTEDNAEEVVTVKRRGNVLVVTVDNPPVNAFSHPTRVALGQAMATPRAYRTLQR